MRINQYLAHNAGLSRREADQYVKASRVLVNGVVCRIGQQIEPSDVVMLDNTEVATKGSFRYVLLNKPVGYVSTRKSQAGEPTVYDLLPENYRDLKIVGRLDRASSGLVLLTDDGNFAHQLMHPRFTHQKVYNIELESSLSEDDAQKLSGGVDIGNGEVSKLEIQQHGPQQCTVTLREGKNRQIRRSFGTLGYTVTALERVQLGPYTLAMLDGAQHCETTMIEL